MVNPLEEMVHQEKQLIGIPEDDLQWSTVTLSEVIEKNNKIVARAFSIESKNIRELLKNSKYELKTICGDNGISTAYRPGICKRVFVEKTEGIPMYTPSQITEINPKPIRYLSKKTKTNLDLWYLNEGEIVLTCSGTIGNISYVSRTLKNKCFSQNLIRIIPDEYPGFLYTYLKSKAGQILLKTNKYGAVIQHIDPQHLEKIIIPNPSVLLKNKINKLIMESFELRDQSNELIEEAQLMLISELQLPPIEEMIPTYFYEAAEIKNYIVSLSQTDKRLDGSYHDPIVKTVLSYIKEHSDEVTTLEDPRISKTIILPGRFKRIYVGDGQGIVFFGGKQLYELNPSNKKYLSLTHHSDRIKEQLTLAQNMVLITCSGTIGKINIVPKHWEGWTANQHIIRVVPTDEKIAGYLYTWLSSDYGHELIKRHTYGAVVDEIDDKHVSKIGIPLLKNKKIQQKINDLVLEANKKRYDAYVLEQNALKIVNDLIKPDMKV